MTVTRVDIAEYTISAFTTAPATRDDLLSAAVAGSAPPGLIEVLESLPEGRYNSLRDLWPELPDVPVGL